MLKLYLIAFASFQACAGFLELVQPVRMFSLWKRWVFSRYFPLHGLFLIAGGFPLLVFKGYLSGIIFWIGIFMVLTGPFLLIYPEKIREVFATAESDFNAKDLRTMIYIDSLIRLAAGIVIIIAYNKTF